MSEHTTGPLREQGGDQYLSIVADDHGVICELFIGGSNPERIKRQLANARRIVAAWNACKGIETETLEREDFTDARVSTVGQAQARADAAEAALAEAVGSMQEIVKIHIGGPHMSAKDGFNAALTGLDRAKNIAAAFIAEREKE